MYQALYRKYRPRCFSDVAGQEHITETLRRQIVSGRLSHAYLFVGTRGTGKTTCAKILSRAVNCLSPDNGEPCNKCLACIGIEDGSILDVLELDAASNNSVDNVRALRDEAIYTPATVKKRVYIIDEVHMLSVSAFNALLKILEEPPEHILFILATTELHKVPATILSRCQKFSFRRLPPSVLAARLNSIAADEGLTLTGEAVSKLAALADGSMRDGISLLDQCASVDIIDLKHVQNTLGLAGSQEMLRLLDKVASRDTVAALVILDELYNDGRDMSSLLGEMAALFRDLLVYKLSPDSGLLNAGYDPAVLSALSNKLSPEQLFYCLELLKTAVSGLSRGGSSKLAVEMCLFRMCDERLSDNPEALVSRISRLETGSTASTVPVNNVSNTTSSAPHHPEPAKDLVVNEIPKEEDTPVADDSPVAEDSSSAEISSVSELLQNDNSTSASENHTSEPTPGSAVSESGVFWVDTLELLRFEPSVYALLSDSSKVQAELNDNILIITVADSFTANSLETELVKEAATKALDRDIVVRVEVGEIKADENKRSKLDSLSAFVSDNFQ